MVAKRKAVLAAAKIGKVGKVELEEGIENDLEEDAAAPTVKVMKKPAAASSRKGAKAAATCEEAEEEPAGEDMEVEGDEAVNEEEAAAKREQEQAAARKKELRAMYFDDLKELLSTAGLATGKKDDMIQALLEHEAKARADLKAKEARMRAVVVQKKEELEGMSAPELKELCASMGIKGVLSKQDRISQLLTQWQADDGVDKALAKMAHDQRKDDLFGKDQATLLQICEEAGVDPYVKEVMVDRIVKRESATGRYARPPVAKKEDSDAPKDASPDMVEALLAQESKRKQEKETKKLAEEAAAGKRKELRSMSVEDLKKLLSTKGREGAGKKEDMVEALFAISVEEEATAKKKKELMSLPIDELKLLLSNRKLETGKKTDMVETFLAHEAKIREESRAYEAKVEEVLAKKKEELETKSASDLKDLCASKGLKLGTAKVDRVETLLEEAKRDGEVDKILETVARDARRDELSTMDKAALRQLCAETGADPLVKEVMVERILAHESEAGATVEDAAPVAGPAAKKARKGAK